MARKVENDKGFLVIGMNVTECTDNCKFGGSDIVICDTCNKLCDGNEEVYYCAVLNSVLCKHCYDNWVNGSEVHDEDVPYETKMYNIYLKQLINR